jgi:glycosyltransferase involved in cell wall biosynthesis
MACGTPVVASRRGALPEVVGDAGLLVDAESQSALTTALLRVLDAPDERAQLAARGLLRAREFAATRTAGRVVDLLQTTAGLRPALSGRAG